MVGRQVKLVSSSLIYIKPELISADFALANLESPLSETDPNQTSGYNLCASPDNAARLKTAGLDILSIVNNHALDCGKTGEQDTKKYLISSGLIPVDETGYSTTLKGLKLTFFAFDDVSSPLDEDFAVNLIHSAHQTGSIVIVSIHWGVEYQSAPTNRQVELAKLFSSAGASLIWGHHPHVLQPVAWIPPACNGDMKKSGCTLVLYSLGNALFDQQGLSDTRRSALFSIELDSEGVISFQLKPFLIDPGNSKLLPPDDRSLKQIYSRLNVNDPAP